ncbi:hypothetical protein [Actinoplanes teichomyceticus]|uniref:Uncharacterized protein n=1 Tax=Actinoplanes teichomyceticus TaxID=1867 RepID=A0A561WLI0_ACTTI|nr:hypothetical protein [Actinoplanes teichomyceticus]TWG24719.1 hypothetical protein FHX34_1021279 [Actinoplanes teichomyceticus]
MATACAVTVGISASSYAALNPQELEARARRVADRATCRTVDTAIVAFIALNDTDPTSIQQLRPYVRGDISGYRIVAGRAAGPGC